MNKLFTCTHCNRIKQTLKDDSCFLQYARDKDSNKICYACASEVEKADMLSTGKAILYFDHTQQKVTNFTGLLSFKVTSVRTSHHNIAGVRYDYWFIFNGSVWHGYTIGNNTMIAYCKKTKQSVG